MEKKEKIKKRSGPTVYCCGSVQSVTLCVSGKKGVVKPTDNVLFLGSGLGVVVKSLSNGARVIWLKEDGSR